MRRRTVRHSANFVTVKPSVKSRGCRRDLLLLKSKNFFSLARIELTNESITELRNSLNEPRAPRVVPERPAYVHHTLHQRVVGDRGPVPDALQQLVLGNQALFLLQEVNQNLKRLLTQVT